MANGRVWVLRGFAALGALSSACGAPPASADEQVIRSALDPAVTPVHAPLRLVAPLSGAISGSRRPVFRWAGPAFSVGEVCRDRGCRQIVSVFVGADHSARSVVPLPAGTLFWRLLDPEGRWTAVWELFEPGGSGDAPHAVLGFHYDANADGFVDAAIDEIRPLVQGVPGLVHRLHVYSGGAAGIAAGRETVIEGSSTPVVVGDVNGDGYGDLAAGPSGLSLFAGGPTGISSAPLSVSSPATPIAAGDINGDGYADVVSGSEFDPNLEVFLGSPAGFPSSGVLIDIAADDPQTFTFPFAAGDFNGDGFGDVVLVRFNGNDFWLGFARGGPGGLLEGGPTVFLPTVDFPQTHAVGDVNGDGIADLVTTILPGVVNVYFGGPSGLPAAPSQSVTFAGAGVIRDVALGDFNGDGILDAAAAIDVATGIMFFDDERVDVHLGSRNGLRATAARSLVETDYFPDNHNRFGTFSTIGGDFDGDGRDDVLIGASTVFPPPPPDGFPLGPSSAFVFRGVAGGGVSPAPAPRLEGDPGFGTHVAATTF